MLKTVLSFVLVSNLLVPPAEAAYIKANKKDTKHYICGNNTWVIRHRLTNRAVGLLKANECLKIEEWRYSDHVNLGKPFFYVWSWRYGHVKLQVESNEELERLLNQGGLDSEVGC